MLVNSSTAMPRFAPLAFSTSFFETRRLVSAFNRRSRHERALTMRLTFLGRIPDVFFGRSLLKRTTRLPIVLSDLFDLVAGIDLTAAVSGDFHSLEINANEIGCPDRCFVRRINGAEKIPLPVLLPNEIRLLFGERIVLAGACRTSGSPSCRGGRYSDGGFPLLTHYSRV